MNGYINTLNLTNMKNILLVWILALLVNILLAIFGIYWLIIWIEYLYRTYTIQIYLK